LGHQPSARLVESFESDFGSPDSPLAFQTTGTKQWPVWDRFISVDGKPAYHIGNVCNTCAFFFERLEGANRSISEIAAVDELASGLTSVKAPAVQRIGHHLPQGRYVACLLEVCIQLVSPGSEIDYFAQEQTALWGIDGFWDMPHQPHTEYYRLGSTRVRDRASLFQFLVPMFPKSWLKPPDIQRHSSALESGQKPTAVSIGVLDIKQPADWAGDPAINQHWCLAHYLLDGHHKTFAALQAGQPLSLLSFVSLSSGVSTEVEVHEALAALGASAA
jgi:hypothetical protein